MTEQVHDEPLWWKSADKNLDVQQRAFKSVVEAIIRKDRRTLEALSSDAGSVADNYRGQIDSMLNFGDYLKSMEAVQFYEVAPVLVALARLRINGKATIATFVFLEQRATYSLLPVRPKVGAYELIREWANAPWGVLSPTGPGYCSDEEIARTDHRLMIISRPDAPFRTSLPVDLKLTPIADKRIASGLPSRVLETYSRMREAAKKDAFAQLMTFLRPGDAKELGNFAAAPQFAGQREALKQTLLGEDPIAVVDGGPLQVLYTRSSVGGTVTVWYFTTRGDGSPQWANVSRLAQLDFLFKSGPLFDAARTDPTFENLKKQN